MEWYFDHLHLVIEINQYYHKNELCKDQIEYLENLDIHDISITDDQYQNTLVWNENLANR